MEEDPVAKREKRKSERQRRVSMSMSRCNLSIYLSISEMWMKKRLQIKRNGGSNHTQNDGISVESNVKNGIGD